MSLSTEPAPPAYEGPRVDYFDTLPLHPQPRPLESLTGYITRLAEANGIRSRKTLQRLLFPTRRAGFLYNLSDHTIPSLDDLARATAAPDSRLLATTLTHLGRKFGLAESTFALGQFIRDAITEGARYCPSCLVANPYRRLTWRLSLLTGCPVHRCRLIERCPYGDHPIPPIAEPFSVTTCSTCEGDLREAAAEPLTESAWRLASRRARDLEYLLAPQPWEEEGTAPVVALGRLLCHVRTARLLSARELAKRAELSVHGVQAIENWDRDRRKGTLRVYVAIAEFLGMSLRDAFDAARRHRDLIAAMEPSISGLMSNKRGLSVSSAAHGSAVPVDGIDWYPSIQQVLDDQHEAIARQREDAMLRRVCDAANTLRSRGERVTRRAVARLLGYTDSGVVFQPFPRVKALLAEMTAAKGSASGHGCWREATWIEKLRGAIAWCRVEHLPVTRERVCERLQIPPRRLGKALYNHPPLRTILAAAMADTSTDPRAAPDGRGAEDDEGLVARVRRAHDSLEANGHPVTADAICALLGISRQRLRASPGAAVLLQQWADDARARSRKERAALREAALLARVREAMRLLEEGGKPVTQHAIATLADMSEAGLSHYPSIRTILRAVAAEARSPAPEERVVARVQEAIEALRTDGRIVTQRAVIRRVRMARETLYRYPRVEAILRHVVQGGTRRRTIGRGRPEKAR